MKRKAGRFLSTVLVVVMLAAATPAMSASAAALTCPGTGGWSSMKYDDATGNTTWYMKDGSVIVQDENGNVIQNTQTAAPSAAATGWTSDTNSDLTVQPGKTYQFKFTAANPDAIKVWMGTPGVFNITKSGQEGGAVYYKITAVGTPGAAAGVYVSYNGGSGTKLCVATVAGGSTSSGGTSSGSTSSGNTSSGGSTSSTPDTSGMTEKQKAAVEAGLTLGDWNHEYEQEVFDLVNEERVKLGLPKLVWARSVTEKAHERAKELSVMYSHTRPNGSSGGWENIGCGDAIPILVEDPSGVHWSLWNGDPKSIVASWMGSEGHYENMMKYEVDDAGNVNGATSMAVGCYVDEDGSIWWVQSFNSTSTDLVNPVYCNPLL